jgi:hypothetical protein
MSTTAATTVTSLDGFHVTPTAQRADDLVRAFFDTVNADDPARTDAVLARSFLSHDVHGTHWESVDWVRVYQSFWLLSEEVDDA